MTGRQPSKAARRRVVDAFDADALIRICEADDFGDYGARVECGPGRFYHYRDNGSNVLAVAHLDTVQSDGRCTIAETAAGLLACSGKLDDRLGAYVILEMLPKLGIVTDVLLTTDEERGDSTAQHFDTAKQYDWLISFDRGGTDVVAYQYHEPALTALVEASGARMGFGSYSDICELEHLGCAGLNWGVGYADYHGARSHAWLADTFRMVARYVKFHGANVGARLPFEYVPWWDDEPAAVVGDFIAGDCGHEIDLADPTSYVVQDATWYLCPGCATAA